MTATTYYVAYQLGSTGRPHRSLRAAIRDLDQSRREARRNGDQQAIVLRERLADGTDQRVFDPNMPWGTP
jgi:hypothetical protein